MLDYFKSSNFPSDFLENPEKYLGPNYKAVLNFYEGVYSNRIVYNALGYDSSYYETLGDVALEVITQEIKQKLPYPSFAFELIAMHLLLSRGETLKFIPNITFLEDL